MFFGGAELLVLVFLGLWVLNWLAVWGLIGALGLRRRRWGTPGGGWAMLSCGLTAAVLAGLIGLLVVANVVGGREMEEVVAPLWMIALLALWVGSNAALAWAVTLAWRAADASRSLLLSQAPPGRSDG